MQTITNNQLKDIFTKAQAIEYIGVVKAGGLYQVQRVLDNKPQALQQREVHQVRSNSIVFKEVNSPDPDPYRYLDLAQTIKNVLNNYIIIEFKQDPLYYSIYRINNKLN